MTMENNTTKKKKSETPTVPLKTWSLRTRKPVNYHEEVIIGLENSVFDCNVCGENFPSKNKLKQHTAQKHQEINCPKCKIILENPVMFNNMSLCSECTVKTAKRQKTPPKPSVAPFANGMVAGALGSLDSAKKTQPSNKEEMEVIEIKPDDDEVIEIKPDDDEVVEIKPDDGVIELSDDDEVSSNVSSQNTTKTVNGKSVPRLPLRNGMVCQNISKVSPRLTSNSQRTLPSRSRKSSSDVNLVVGEKRVTFEITTHDSLLSVPPKSPLVSRIIENVSTADSTLPIIQSVCSAGIVLPANTLSTQSVQASTSQQQSRSQIDPILSRILNNKEITVTPILELH